MIAADQLETAIEYRDRLAQLRVFKRGLIDEAWNGPVKCTFGGYEVTLSMGSTFEPFRDAVLAEEKMLLNTLEILGVKI